MAVFKIIAHPPTDRRGLKALLGYVLQEEKTEEKLVSATGDFQDYNYGYIYDRDRVYEEFHRVQAEYHKERGRLCSHCVMSFPPGEVKPQLAHELGTELADKLWPGHQVLVVTHIDKAHIHNHFIVNSVSYVNGDKIHTSKKDLQQMKKICDSLCLEHGLGVAEKGKHTNGTDIEEGTLTTNSQTLWRMISAGKKSFLADCAAAVSECARSATSREEFIQQMQLHGWTVQWTEERKHIVFHDGEGHRIRDTRLMSAFHVEASKEGLEQRFAENAAVRQTQRVEMAKRAEQEKTHRKHHRHR